MLLLAMCRKRVQLYDNIITRSTVVESEPGEDAKVA